ncbi:hypothetical protein FF2_005426 [Malus domestica]
MSSKSGVSTSGGEASEPNPNPDHTPKPLENQLAALALSEVDSHRNDIAHGSATENNHQEIENDEEEVQANLVTPRLVEVEEASEGSPHGRVGSGVVWAMTNSKLEIDGLSSPSSNGYADDKLTEKAIFGLVHCAKYNKAPIALKYGTSGPRTISSSSFGHNGSFLMSKERTIIGLLSG